MFEGVEPYVDFDYYLEVYGGKEIEDYEKFNYLVKRVSPILDEITFDRLDRLEEIPDVVKHALCAMIDAYSSYTVEGQDRRVKSENNDGFSQTFSDYDERTVNKQIVDAGKVYLINTGLLYKGWSRKYDSK